jgi:hypothetical protein
MKPNHLLIILLLVIIGCQNKKISIDKDEFYAIESLLDSLIFHQYTLLKNIDTASYHNRNITLDSIYLIGNMMLNKMNFNIQQHYHDTNFIQQFTNYSKFLDYSNELNINDKSGINTLRLKIKLLQYKALVEEYQHYCLEHYPVDMMGLRVLNDPIKKGGKATIAIIPIYYYFSSFYENYPLIVINSDTLQFDSETFKYYYDVSFNKSGTHKLDASITWRQFDMTLYTTKTSLHIEVE